MVVPYVKDLINKSQVYTKPLTSKLPGNLPYKQAIISALACRIVLNISYFHSAVIGSVLGCYVFDKIPRFSYATALTGACLSYAYLNTTFRIAALIGTAAGALGYY